MARDLVRRREVPITIPFLTLGLDTIHEPLVGNSGSAQLFRNARGRNQKIVKRNGTVNYSDTIGTGTQARCSAVHQWYPSSDPSQNLLYALSNGVINRFPIVTNPNYKTAKSAMSFLSGYTWARSTYGSFCDYGDYCFAFNGINHGAQMILGSYDSMYEFMIAKAEQPTATYSAGGGSMAAGDYIYKVKYLRKVGGIIQYWGAYSDAATVTVSAGTAKVIVGYTIPTDPQITHISICRSLQDLETVYDLVEIEVGTATGTYTDTAEFPADTMEDDVLDRIVGAKWCCVDDGSLFLLGTAAEDNAYYNSNTDRPQVFGLYNNGLFTEGSGKTTGCVSFNGNVLMFKESGISVMTKDTNGYYQQISMVQGFGNVAPWSLKVVKDSANNFVTFWDNVEGPCLFTASGVQSLKRRKNSDVVDVVENQIDRNYKKFISVGYHNGFIFWWYTPIGDTYNVQCIVYDTLQDSWYGTDTGYPTGPTCLRLGGKGVYGNNECIGAYDGTTVRLVEVDANSTKDFGSNITLDVKSMRVYSPFVNQNMTYLRMDFIAKLGGVCKITVKTESGYSTGDYYIAPSGKYFYDDGSTWDSITFDDAVASLFDSAYFDSGDLFDSVEWRPYKLLLPSSVGGGWLEFNIYDSSEFSYEFSGIKITAMERGVK